jgi:branched-chain amino acid transport system substrate-binding protein
VAVLMADYVYGQETSRGFVRAARQLSAEIVTEVRHPIGMSDYSPFFSKIQAAKPDLLLVSNFGRDQQIALRQITEFGLKKQMKVAVPILVHTARLVEGHETYDGVVGCMSYYWKLEDTIPSAKAFNAAYRSLHGGIAPTDYSALGYSCVRTLLAASRDAGNTDSASVIKALEKLEYDFTKGKQYFRRCDHQSVQSVVVLTSKGPGPGVAKDDIFEILAVEAEGEKTLRTCEELGYPAN